MEHAEGEYDFTHLRKFMLRVQMFNMKADIKGSRNP
jgi:hypothetical protein